VRLQLRRWGQRTPSARICNNSPKPADQATQAPPSGKQALLSMYALLRSRHRGATIASAAQIRPARLAPGPFEAETDPHREFVPSSAAK
jgi:hypothetical protein